jgi:catechol 2,3-dioxygenase-like lactoylglutathione lyase family enzyme
VIGVPDLEAAAAELSLLLAVDATPGEQGALLLLPNTCIELVAGEGDRARIQGLRLRGTPPSSLEPLPDGISVNDGTAIDARRAKGAPVSPLLVDHVVLQTRDAEGCIALYRDRLGIRLALDREVPEWGGRMLFFRAGKMTLEVIANPDTGPASPRFWGVAFQCADIEAEHARLASGGVELSEIRDGRKPGTRVATVKSHCLGLPTLLIEPAPR